MAKTKQEIEENKQKRKIKLALKKVNKLLNEANNVYETIPRPIQNALYEVHSSECSINHCLRWGLQSSEELQRNDIFEKAVKDYL